MKNIKLNKRALSGVVTVVILIMLTVVLISVVWVVINGLVKKQIDQSEACFGVFDKVQIGNGYTCLNGTNLQISIEVGDVELEKILISVAGEGNSKSFDIPYSVVDGFLANYPLGDDGFFPQEASLPGENSGKTYVVDLVAFGILVPEKIEIVPIIDGVQCSVSDSFENIENCDLFV